MRIEIMAAGAVGGYLGGRLQAAGHDVVYFARGAHLAALRQRGLTVESPLGNLQLTVNATDDPAKVDPVDAVIFAVKLWDTEAAGALLKPIVTPDTRVVTLQNGVDSVERLVPILGADVVMGGTALIATVIKEPGVISHTSQFAQVRCGRVDGRADDKLATFVAASRAAGIDIALSEAIERDRWQKFVFLVGLSGATALTRQPIGVVLADPDTRGLFRALLDETAAVGRARGVPLAADFADDRFDYALSVPYGMKASMLHDLERGNRLELDWLAGRVVELGRALGVPVPANTGVYAALKLHRMGHGS